MSKKDDDPDKGHDDDAPTDDEQRTALVGNRDGRPDLHIPVDLVEAAGLGIGDMPEVERRGGEIVVRGEREERDDAERWAYPGRKGSVRIRSPVVDAAVDEVGLTVRTYPVDPGAVPLGFEFDDDDRHAGALADLSPADAEALAVDLLEQAHAARDDDE